MPAIQLNQLHLKTIFYSVILHSVVLGLFVFIVPVKASSNKPIFVFFGAILQNTKLTDLSASQNNLSSVLLTPKPNFLLKTETPYNDRSVSKPVYREAIKSAPKFTPKKVEPLTAPVVKNANLNKTENPPLPSLPEYKPLRFQTK
ncbi:MAG: hypothetical protein KBD53_05300 [Candidatus Omnitrophica bacterium]|nr:hypothetical protein [Candidatus Omnitrophota bacterium]